MNKKSLLSILGVCAFFSACNVPTPEVIEFAVSPKIIEVPAEGGVFTAQVFSNNDIKVTLASENEWATLETETRFTGDGYVGIEFTENEGLRRSLIAYVEYNGGAAKDSVYFRQEGETATLSVPDPNLFIDSRNGLNAELGISTNIAPEEIEVEVLYGNEASDWISNIGIAGEKVSLTLSGAEPEKIKKASLVFSHTDGWGEHLSCKASIMVSDNEGAFGKEASFEDVRRENPGTIDKFSFIRAIVVSDCDSKNMEMNPSTDYNVVDTTPSDKTAYVENEDGSLGFKIVFDDAADNTLHQKQLINIHLNGLYLTRETDPERYTISGLSTANIEPISEVGALPVKTKKIAELTDNDVHTFVNLQETEFINKEGCYANVYDSFTLPSSFNTTSVSAKMHGDCWAGMLVDSDGKTIYAMVNMLCPWRRNGSGVPQGVGTLKGIIVHNEQPRYGDLGRYQIRVVDDKGYAQKLTTGSSFSVVAKWDGKQYAYNFTNYGSFFPYSSTNNGMDSIIPSDDFNKTTGAHVAELSFENKMGQPTSGTKSLRPCQSFDAVKMGSNGGRVSNRALSIQCNIGGWYNWNEDGTLESINGIVADLSTVGMEGQRLFYYYAFCNGGAETITFKNFPGRWCVEYSTDGGASYKICNAVESGKEYIHLRAYPFSGPTNISGRDYYPTYSTGLGQTEHLVELPADAMGKENVKIRLRPYDTTITTLPEDLSADIENAQAYKGLSIYEDLRINRIIIFKK